jgi:hypothetical protein
MEALNIFDVSIIMKEYKLAASPPKSDPKRKFLSLFHF